MLDENVWSFSRGLCVSSASIDTLAAQSYLNSQLTLAISATEFTDAKSAQISGLNQVN